VVVELLPLLLIDRGVAEDIAALADTAALEAASAVVPA
jgi:hypothetical protein